MGILWQDLRYGLRMLFKHPGFTAVAVIALALGIGANTAIFSVVNAVLLRPLPFPKPEQLVILTVKNLRPGNSFDSPASYPDFRDWRAQNRVFERVAAYHTSSFTLTGGSEPAHLQGAIVSADLFQLLGVSPSLGRTFLPAEDRPGGSNGSNAVILSHSLWQQRFSSDPNILGRSLVLDGKSYNVIGVMPKEFKFPIQADPVDLWTTFAIDSASPDGSPPLTEQRGAHFVQVIARLKSNTSVEQAQEDMISIMSNLEKQYPDTNAHFVVRTVPALESLIGDTRPALLILLGAVGCVLLIACANVANLLLARATSRHKEIAIRAALGASRWRVVRQLLTESVLLSLGGGATGLLLALWGTDVLVALGPRNIPRLTEISLDSSVLFFTLLISLLTGVIFGLAPALHATKSDLTESLKEGGRGSTEGALRNRVRSALVVAEIAIALVLLVSASLLIQSFLRLERVAPGFNPHHVLTFSLDLPETRYSTVQQAAFYRQLISRIETLPGVTQASAVLPLPLSRSQMGVGFEIEGRPMAQGDLPETDFSTIGLNYFHTMGIPLVKGRDFTAHDDLKSTPVCIINETLARKYFPGEDPLGKRIKPTLSVDNNPPPMREIVGVVGDVKHRNLSAESGPEVYVPHAQVPFSTMAVIVRTETEPQSITAAVQREVRSLDKDLPLINVRTLDEYVSTSVERPRFNTLLLGIFAAVALILTAVGLYGVLAYTVAQRTHEIGIRMALGAQTRNVLRLVIGQGMLLALIGIGTGLAVAWMVTRLLASLLYGISARDPVTFAGVALLLSAVALLACYIPARRATRVDPVIALRYE